MIHVVAHITAKPGQRQAILDRFHANIPAVHAEEGCIEYQPVIDASGFDGLATALGEDSFVVVEKWSSETTLKAHAASKHMAEYATSVKDLIASRTIYVLENTG